jgi:hypothetical protein
MIVGFACMLETGKAFRNYGDVLSLGAEDAEKTKTPQISQISRIHRAAPGYRFCRPARGGLRPPSWPDGRNDISPSHSVKSVKYVAIFSSNTSSYLCN